MAREASFYIRRGWSRRLCPPGGAEQVADESRLVRRHRAREIGIIRLRLRFAEDDVQTDDRGPIVLQRINKTRLNAARPWPSSELRDAAFVDVGDRNHASRPRHFLLVDGKIGSRELEAL